MQPDLFANSNLDLKPMPGRTEPRLWVRRLIVWREPGKEVRNIELRPGLNVIWSPDDGSQRGQIGHGGGKTTFCRLLRYCLGEDSCGPEAQRRALFDAFPMGHVGAEVRLDGETWLIRRSFGPNREDFALKATAFADFSSFPPEPTGIQPFRDAATRAFLEGALQLMPASLGADNAWHALLAWMTRDQECRFGHLLDWRSPDSGSRSPVSGRNRPQDDREEVLRIVLNALRSEEIATRRERDSLNAAVTGQRTQISRLSWQFGQSRRRLTEALGLDTSNASGLDATIITATAAEQLAKLQGLSSPVSIEQLRSERRAVERTLREESEAKAAIELATNREQTEETIAKLIADELPELSAQNQRLQHPVCPVCGILIDKARTEGCGISLQSCDLEALRDKVNQRIETWKAATAEVSRLRSQLPDLRHRFVVAGQMLAQQRKRLAALEDAAFKRSEALRRAERNLDGAAEFALVADELAKAERALEQSEGRLKTLGEELESHRSAVADLIGVLSDRFDAVFREIVRTDARCSVKLDGNGLSLRVPVDGAAIDSLKVAVFDMAVLSMAIEGRTRHPGFLIHDSPREADLGGSIYAGLFDLARKLEKSAPTPLFQYIVTTTTKPPGKFAAAPWLCLTLRGAPAEQRLLKIDL